MVILKETHDRILRKVKIKAVVAFVLACVLLGVTIVQMEEAKKEMRKSKAECQAWADETKGLLAKQEILNVLKSKPMTIGQAMEVIEAVTTQRDIPIRIVIAMIDQESEFRPQAVSYKGARGLTQVMPDTIRYYIKDPALLKQIDRPSVNVTGGLMHLAYLNDKFGNWDKSLRAYFAGEDNVHNKAFDWYPRGVLRKASKYTYLE